MSGYFGSNYWASNYWASHYWRVVASPTPTPTPTPPSPTPNPLGGGGGAGKWSRYAEERRMRREMEEEICKRKKRLEFVVALIANDFDVSSAITDLQADKFCPASGPNRPIRRDE